MSAQKRTSKMETQQTTKVQNLQVEELEERIAPAGVIVYPPKH